VSDDYAPRFGRAWPAVRAGGGASAQVQRCAGRGQIPLGRARRGG